MKKQRILIYSMFFLGAFVLEGCFESPGTDILLNNAAEVEIQEAGTSAGLEVSKSYARLNDGIPKKDSIRVNLIGPQRSTPINVSFVIDPASTAVAGVHYVLVSTSQITIPANSSFGYIYYNIKADAISASESWKLKFNLTAADVKINANFSTFTRIIRIACPFSRPNFIGKYDTNEPGYGHYDNTTVADATNAAAVTISNFWDFSGFVKYVFTTTSPVVTLPSQDVVMGGTTYVVAGTTVSGSYDACTYQFIVPYTVRRKSDNALFDNNTHTFTHK